MQTKIYNAYKITHKNGSVEDINALDLVQALENMEIPDTESKVLQAYLVKENVKTLVADEPTEILFSAVVTNGSGGSIATPASGKIHVGDQLSFKAIPAKNYAFVDWKLNGEVISTEETFVLTMPELPSGIDTAVFSATFKLADVEWTSKVEPEEASGAGCIAFPANGKAPANSNIQLLAVAETGYTFDHWERNGNNIGDNKLLSLELAPLYDGETECVFTAVFTQD